MIERGLFRLVLDTHVDPDRAASQPGRNVDPPPVVPGSLDPLGSILGREIALVIAHDEDEFLPRVPRDGSELLEVDLGRRGEERVEQLEAREPKLACQPDHPDLIDLPRFERLMERPGGQR